MKLPTVRQMEIFEALQRGSRLSSGVYTGNRKRDELKYYVRLYPGAEMDCPYISLELLRKLNGRGWIEVTRPHVGSPSMVYHKLTEKGVLAMVARYKQKSRARLLSKPGAHVKRARRPNHHLGQVKRVPR